MVKRYSVFKTVKSCFGIETPYDGDDSAISGPAALNTFRITKTIKSDSMVARNSSFYSSSLFLLLALSFNLLIFLSSICGMNLA